MMLKLTSVGESAPPQAAMRVVLVTMDSHLAAAAARAHHKQIGRASCRERV